MSQMEYDYHRSISVMVSKKKKKKGGEENRNAHVAENNPRTNQYG